MDIKTLLDTPPWDWPRDAAKTFRQILMDRRAKASDRLAAAELAGDLVAINDDLAGALIATVGSAGELEQLRARAAISLGPVLQIADIDGFEDPEEVPITERTFHDLQESLHKLYLDSSVPKEVRRRVLEASVRAPMDWHQDAIRTAYGSGDQDWVLTAVFSMRWVRGFDQQILEALKSRDQQIHQEAVQAAGNWGLKPAWPHVAALIKDPATPKALLLAAIGAVVYIRPEEAEPILADLTDSDDEDIAEAANEAIAMAEATSDGDDEEEDEDEGGEWIN